MEERGFIHADISPRNVMVTAEGKHKGDMALVDFDGFVCAAYQIPDTHLKGSEGFAAPEIWEQESLTKGSDRVGMAILIEQFLTAGQPTVPYKEALFWEYSQQELVSLKSRANPHFRRLYPELADVLDKTLSASSPEERPSPKMWEELLFKEYSRAAARPEPPTRLDTPSSRQATSTNTRSSGVVLRRVEISSDSSSRAERIQLADVAARLDLSNSSFQIRADLVRHADGTITLEVHDRAEVRVRDSSGVWRRIAGGDFIPVASDLEFYDTQGANKARLTGERISLAS
jgi:serine/threonine protein kinase